MKKIIIKRLKEPSTWMGISMLAAIFGVPPETLALGAKLVSAFGAIAGVALPENP